MGNNCGGIRDKNIKNIKNIKVNKDDKVSSETPSYSENHCNKDDMVLIEIQDGKVSPESEIQDDKVSPESEFQDDKVSPEIQYNNHDFIIIDFIIIDYIEDYIPSKIDIKYNCV